MSINYKKAVQQAKKELETDAIEEVKAYILDTLKAIEATKKEIADKNAELKALKADLYDLENGKLNKIKERQEKDKVAERVSKVDLEDLAEKAPQLIPYISTSYTDRINAIGYTTSASTSGNVNAYYQVNGTAGGNLTGNGGGASGANFVANGAGGSSNLAYSKADVEGTYTVSLPNGTQKSYYIR